MADSPPGPETDDALAPRPKTGPTPGTPRWVKVFGVIITVLVLVIVAMLVAGGGSHGPGRHLPSGDAGGRTAPTDLRDDRSPSGAALSGHAPPSGGSRPREHGP